MNNEQLREEFEAWCKRNEYDHVQRLDGTGYNNEATKRAWKAWQARAALQSQGRVGAYIPKKRMDYVASITDSDPHIAQREGYVEGWNDCRQDIIDHARRGEGES